VNHQADIYSVIGSFAPMAIILIVAFFVIRAIVRRPKTVIAQTSSPGTVPGGTYFKHPITGQIEDVSNAWLWALIFWPFYFAYKKLWIPAVILVLCLFFLPAYFIAGIIYAIRARRLVAARNMQLGWVEMTPHRET